MKHFGYAKPVYYYNIIYPVSMSLFCLNLNLVYLLYLCPSLDISFFTTQFCGVFHIGLQYIQSDKLQDFLIFFQITFLDAVYFFISQNLQSKVKWKADSVRHLDLSRAPAAIFCNIRICVLYCCTKTAKLKSYLFLLIFDKSNLKICQVLQTKVL